MIDNFTIVLIFEDKDTMVFPDKFNEKSIKEISRSITSKKEVSFVQKELIAAGLKVYIYEINEDKNYIIFIIWSCALLLLSLQINLSWSYI